jgi:hypothetical protein
MIQITFSSVHIPHLLLQFLTSKIAIILILENACLFYASQPQPDRSVALDRAYSLYKTSQTHIAASKEFSASSMEYSIPQLTEFILVHRL